MKKSDYGILFLVALVFYSLLATLQKLPGYMDAEYYYGQGIRLFHHYGASEPFIWNYLNNPTNLPVPSFTFWMPMTSILVAAGLGISGNVSFFAAKILFILMASSVVLLSAFFADKYQSGRRIGWLAGLLAMFSGFYLPFVTITDTFTPYMFFGGLFFVSIWMTEKWLTESKKFNPWFVLIGVFAGLMSLTRSDGVLWLAGGWIAVLVIKGDYQRNWKKIILGAGMVLLGFAVVMVPWYLRNCQVFQAFFPSGNGLMLWLTKYEDLFVYPSRVVTFSRWFETGIGVILLDRLKALSSNLQTLIASGGVIVLTPLIIIGLWKQRKKTLIQVAIIMLIGIITVMTVLFPYAGERGGFFHSLSAVQVVLWSLVPIGLNTIIQWGVKHRQWKTERSWKMFGLALVVVVGLISAVIFSNKLQTGIEGGIPWNQTQKTGSAIEEGIINQTGDQTSVVMVNDPPGYSLVTGRRSVMIPSGEEKDLIEAASQFKVRFIAINDERTDVLDQMNKSSLFIDHFEFMFEVLGNRVYEFKP